jgi:PhnB protein
MKQMITYLNFDGNAAEAMTFYARCLKGDLHMMRFSESSMEVPSGAENRVMHAKISTGSAVLMASDTMPGIVQQKGTNFHICLNSESFEETERLFRELGENGKITMPLQQTFWGARFGMVVDQFGISWMFNFEKPKS